MARTQIANIEYENGVIHVKIDEHTKQNLECAREIVNAAKTAAGGKRSPILVDTRNTVSLDTETRHFYTGQELFRSFSALALVVEATPMGLLRGNIYFRVAKPTIPVKLFNDPAPARKWIQQFAENAGEEAKGD